MKHSYIYDIIVIQPDAFSLASTNPLLLSKYICLGYGWRPCSSRNRNNFQATTTKSSMSISKQHLHLLYSNHALPMIHTRHSILLHSISPQQRQTLHHQTHNAGFKLRSSLNAHNFLIASSSGTKSPLFWVSGKSRFRILTLLLSLSCAPTTKMKLYACNCPVRIFFCIVLPEISTSTCMCFSRKIFWSSRT